MLSKTLQISVLVFTLTAVLSGSLSAQLLSTEISELAASKTLTVDLRGTLGPILSGSDPLGLNGQKSQLVVEASEALKPTKHTSNSATYTLPPGAITISVGSYKFQSNGSSTMVITLAESADVVTLSGSFSQYDIQVTGTGYLKAGSWTKSVLKHPTTFHPSPQKLKSAKTSNGPGSKVEYTFSGSATVLGFTGTASCSEALIFSFSDDLTDQ